MFAQNRSVSWLTLVTLACLVATTNRESVFAQDVSLSSAIIAIKNVGLNADGYPAATAAANQLASQPSSNAAGILAAMRDATPLAKNWLRIVAADVGDNGTFPKESLLAFFRDRTHDNDARHAAYQMLIASDPLIKPTLLVTAVDDPSLPIRHQAIAALLDQAKQEKEAGNNDAAKSLYAAVIASGRNPDQLQGAIKAMDDLGEKIDLAVELGLIRKWWVIGTFDNTDSAEFATIYPPESVCVQTNQLPGDWLKAGAIVPDNEGSDKSATTHFVTSEDSFGVVDINPTLEKAKDVIAYCYVKLEIPEAIDAVARLGCITASKVWVNGDEVMANEVYHSGSRIDQYEGDCQLKSGTNTVLLKICQNAQTEPWAQDWQFQFRFTDRFGAAIKPTQTIQPQ